MRQRISIGVAFQLAIAIALAASSEPQFDGHSLSYWAAQIDPHVPTLAEINGVPVPPPAHQTAIRSIGTNTLPTLLKWIAQKDPTNTWCCNPSQGMRAEWCFDLLGSTGSPAIPQLAAMAMKFPDQQRYGRCITALNAVGPKAVPSLKQILTIGSRAKQMCVLQCVLTLDTNSAPILLPGVIKCLTGKDEYLGWMAADVLNRSPLPERLALPALTNALPTASTAARGRIFRCLYWSNYPAKEAIPFLKKGLSDSNAQIRQEATWALGRIAPEVLTNASPKNLRAPAPTR